MTLAVILTRLNITLPATCFGRPRQSSDTKVRNIKPKWTRVRSDCNLCDLMHEDGRGRAKCVARSVRFKKIHFGGNI